jgi:hypothetical protein
LTITSIVNNFIRSEFYCIISNDRATDSPLVQFDKNRAVIIGIAFRLSPDNHNIRCGPSLQYFTQWFLSFNLITKEQIMSYDNHI